MVLSDAVYACIYVHYSYEMSMCNYLLRAVVILYWNVNSFFLVCFEREELFLWGGMLDGEHKM